MLPRPVSRSEPSADDLLPSSPPDLTRLLEQHVAAAFPPDIALDLVLNELVSRAADATRASGAALALFRGDEMVCRAATGLHAPDLGIPLNTSEGLSGACVRSRLPQLCNDAESDPRVDPATSRRLGIRSMLIVPVFDDKADYPDINSEPALAGILEVLSPLPNAFSKASEIFLEEFAREVARVRRVADRLRDQAPAADPHLLKSFDSIRIIPAEPVSHAKQPYEAWTLILGGLVICAAVWVSFMVGSRVGWLHPAPPRVAVPASEVNEVSDSAPAPEKPRTTENSEAQESKGKIKAKNKTAAAGPTDKQPEPSAGELVVYDKGKVIFRLKQPASGGEAVASSESASAQRSAGKKAAARSDSPIVAASSRTRLAPARAVWLAPEEAEDRLVSRVEPKYPPAAVAAHRSGNVVLEVHVAEDGTVTSVRTLLGDPLLAGAAAEAVRTWRYQPYRANEHAAPFQTDVALTFSLPN